ncbi:MAG: hypothetical protein M4579_005750 [Chaenotheca gracillima]|nr:MAG: hypothetical protein M4579_005750 [Chaenotheca gracillima]
MAIGPIQTTFQGRTGRFCCEWWPPQPIGGFEKPRCYVVALKTVAIGSVSNGSEPDESNIDIERVLKSANEPCANALRFLQWTARRLSSSRYQPATLTNIILPADDGFLVRSDILRERLYGCEAVEHVEEFVSRATRLSGYRPMRSGQTDDLVGLLSYAAGAVMPNSQDGQDGAAIDTELGARLTLPWLTPALAARKTLAVVGPRVQVIMETWLTAALNLDIQLVLVGPSGSWLQDVAFVKPVLEYKAIDMRKDAELPQRIARALSEDDRAYDGLTTFTDSYLVPTAQAAKILGLSTSPPASVETAFYKDRLRKLFPGDCQSNYITTTSELRAGLDSGRIPGLRYPLVVKPSTGWGSEGVSKVDDEAELFGAVSELEISRNGLLQIVESYVDGPEVDANFALFDGELVFFELIDDFPCTAEQDDPAPGDHFVETQMVYPSLLPTEERELIRDTIYKILMQLGLRTGVFHVEARISNSTMEYTGDGGVDLRPRTTPPTAAPIVTLLEINQRAPGASAQWATKVHSGIDWTALHLLAALNDASRFQALAVPTAREHQPPTAVIFASADMAGTYNGEDFAIGLKRRRPDLGRLIRQGGSYYGRTCHIQEAPEMVGHLVISTDSRGKMMEALREIGREMRLPIMSAGRVACDVFW